MSVRQPSFVVQWAPAVLGLVTEMPSHATTISESCRQTGTTRKSVQSKTVDLKEKAQIDSKIETAPASLVSSLPTQANPAGIDFEFQSHAPTATPGGAANSGSPPASASKLGGPQDSKLKEQLNHSRHGKLHSRSKVL